MIVIGERINGMFTAVRDAIQTQNKSVLQDLAKQQLDAGANYLFAEIEAGHTITAGDAQFRKKEAA